LGTIVLYSALGISDISDVALLLWEFTENVKHANTVMVREILLIIKSLSDRNYIYLSVAIKYLWFYIFKLMVAAFGWLIMVCYVINVVRIWVYEFPFSMPTV